MSTTTRQAALFGGALFTAGLAVAEPQFTPIDGAGIETYAYAYDSNTFEVAYDTGGIETLMFTAGESSATAAIESQRLFTEAMTLGTGEFSRGTGVVAVTTAVTESVVARLQWDFADDLFGTIEITDPRIGSHIFLITGFENPRVGTAFVPLDAGVQYSFFLRAGANASDGTPKSAFAIVVLPAPSSACLFGLAGLAAARRRRRSVHTPSLSAQ